MRGLLEVQNALAAILDCASGKPTNQFRASSDAARNSTGQKMMVAGTRIDDEPLRTEKETNVYHSRFNKPN